jgi:hypothetical protein
MFDSTRRSFLRQTAAGLATFGASGLVLSCHAQPTQEVNRDRSNQILIQMSTSQDVATKDDLKRAANTLISNTEKQKPGQTVKTF